MNVRCEIGVRDGDVDRLGAAACCRRWPSPARSSCRPGRAAASRSERPVAGFMLAPVGRPVAVYVSGSPSSLVAVTVRLSVCPSATVAVRGVAGKIGAVSVGPNDDADRRRSRRRLRRRAVASVGHGEGDLVASRCRPRWASSRAWRFRRRCRGSASRRPEGR